MNYIEPHAHMVSRTTDDYQTLAMAGAVGLTEPAFWAGYDRSSAQGFYDYFRLLTEYEPARAARFGIQHYTWLCINPKEAEDVGLAREVMALIPQFIDRPNVLGIGEIGLNKNSRNEITVFQEHLDLAARFGCLVLIHTPHLEDKFKGTRLILDVLERDSRIARERVLIDHVEEHTAPIVLEAGYWAGITLYPETKCTQPRAVDLVEVHGAERLCVNSACDWGVSDPLAVPKFALEMRRRGHDEEEIEGIIFRNPCRFLGQSPKFKIKAC
jgi:predicted metal-dependent TIM-barrel fold hydrolase